MAYIKEKLIKNTVSRYWFSLISKVRACVQFLEFVLKYPSSFFTAVPCILILSKSFIYQLMRNRVALKEY
jgi:hypothetical protein